VLSYRAYRLANITGADWSVTVTKSLTLDNSTTDLTVFLLKEEDYLKAANISMGPPPFGLALPDTLCISTSCQGSVRHLGSQRGVYRLWISYPNYYNYAWDGSYSLTSPVTVPYAQQVVEVSVTAKHWRLFTAPDGGRSLESALSGVTSPVNYNNNPGSSAGEARMLSSPMRQPILGKAYGSQTSS